MSHENSTSQSAEELQLVDIQRQMQIQSWRKKYDEARTAPVALTPFHSYAFLSEKLDQEDVEYGP